MRAGTIIGGLCFVMLFVLALSGCGKSPSVKDIAAERDECHSYGGVFYSGKTELGVYWSECVLSDDGVNR